MTNILLTALLFFLQSGSPEEPSRGAAEAATMTTGGWVFMACAWFFILTLVYYTFSKVLRGSGHK
jgi:hypothetical protein